MKTLVFIILMLSAAFQMYAQNYQINFAGTGASTTLDSVKVENLSQCTSLTIAGTDTLILTSTIGINEFRNPRGIGVTIYPNPSPGDCSVEFEATSGSTVSISLSDMTGKTVLQKTTFFREGNHSFFLTGIQHGVYTLKVESSGYLYTAKLISYATGTGCLAINGIASASGAKKSLSLTGTAKLRNFWGPRSIISMQFNAGDTLKLTGKSGNSELLTSRSLIWR